MNDKSKKDKKNTEDSKSEEKDQGRPVNNEEVQKRQAEHREQQRKLAEQRQREQQQRQREKAPLEAVNKVHDILKPLSVDERTRVIDSVMILLGMKD